MVKQYKEDGITFNLISKHKVKESARKESLKFRNQGYYSRVKHFYDSKGKIIGYGLLRSVDKKPTQKKKTTAKKKAQINNKSVESYKKRIEKAKTIKELNLILSNMEKTMDKAGNKDFAKFFSLHSKGLDKIDKLKKKAPVKKEPKSKIIKKILYANGIYYEYSENYKSKVNAQNAGRKFVKTMSASGRYNPKYQTKKQHNVFLLYTSLNTLKYQHSAYKAYRKQEGLDKPKKKPIKSKKETIKWTGGSGNSKNASIELGITTGSGKKMPLKVHIVRQYWKTDTGSPLHYFVIYKVYSKKDKRWLDYKSNSFRLDDTKDADVEALRMIKYNAPDYMPSITKKTTTKRQILTYEQRKKIYVQLWAEQFTDTKDMAEIFDMPVDKMYRILKDFERKGLASSEPQSKDAFGYVGSSSGFGADKSAKSLSLLWQAYGIDDEEEEIVKRFDEVYKK